MDLIHHTELSAQELYKRIRGGVNVLTEGDDADKDVPTKLSTLTTLADHVLTTKEKKTIKKYIQCPINILFLIQLSIIL